MHFTVTRPFLWTYTNESSEVLVLLKVILVMRKGVVIREVGGRVSLERGSTVHVKRQVKWNVHTMLLYI